MAGSTATVITFLSPISIARGAGSGAFEDLVINGDHLASAAQVVSELQLAAANETDALDPRI